MSHAAILQSIQSRVLIRAQLKSDKGVPFSNATLLRLERKGQFPRRFHLSAKVPAWLESDIDQWIESRRLNPTSARVHTDPATTARMAKRAAR